MFLEALNMDLKSEKSLNDNAWINSLDKTYCYCFVLQHPDNHFVLDIEKPTLYLVGVYHLNKNTVTHVDSNIYEEWPTIQNSYDYDNIKIVFPKRYFTQNKDTVNAINEIEESLKDTDNLCPLWAAGNTLYNSTGNVVGKIKHDKIKIFHIV